MFKKVSHLFVILLCGFMFFGCAMQNNESDGKSGTTTSRDITVSFDTLGGNKIEPMLIKKGTDIADIEWPTPVKEDCTFVRWVDQNGFGPSANTWHNDENWVYFSFLTDWSTDTEYTLYATWKSDNPCLIFDADGGKFIFEDGTEKEKVSFHYNDFKDSYDETNIDQYVQARKDELNLIVKKEHYNFDYWLDANPTNILADLKNGCDHTITVAWTPAKELTFKTDGGTELPVYEFKNTVSTNTLYSDDSFIVTKTDYVFAGWYLDAELTVPFENWIYDSKTLFAKWVKKDYEVTQSSLSSTLAELTKAMSYKGYAGSIKFDDVTETRVESETFNLKYTGIMSEDDVAALNAALQGFTYGETVYVNLDLSAATGLTSIPVNAFFDCHGLCSIQISEKITYIQSDAFLNCWNLKTVNLPAKLLSIQNKAFAQCSSLTSITIPEGVGSLGSEVFKGCSALTAITLPVSLVSVGSGCFAATGIEEIELPEGITEVTDSLFESCESLSKVTLSDKVEQIGVSAFSACSALTSIEIPSRVSQIGSSAFEKCTSLEGIDLQKNTSLTEINANTFMGCTSMKSFKIHDSLEKIGDSAFEDCEVLENQNYLNKTQLTEIGEKAFQNCISITEMKLPSNVNTIGQSAFNACVSLKKINIPKQLVGIASHTFDGCGALGTVTFENDSVLLSIGERAFVDCSSLNGFTIPATVQKIEPNAFLNCVSLTSITIPSSVTMIDVGAFENCTKLSSITFENTNGWKILKNSNDTGTAVTETLTDTTENANLLRSKYVSKIWMRS